MARNFTDRAVFDGETITGTWKAPAETTDVVVKFADDTRQSELAATKNSDGTFTATTATDTLAGFSGLTRWIVYATTSSGTVVLASGRFYIRPIVSRYRAVVAAIETALQNWGNNPNKTISVDSINITYKDRDDLLGVLAYWRGRAEADENGIAPQTGGVKIVKVRF